MNRAKTLYWVLRLMGAREVGLRAGVYLRRMLGTTRRQFSPRPWDSIQLAEICATGTPVEPATYAAFKKQQGTSFFFPLGRPPKPLQWLAASEGQRQPALAERLRLVTDDRPVYCFQTPSPAAIDWNANLLNGGHAPGDRIWCEIPDFDKAQGDMRLLWDPARAAWAIDLARGYAR